MNDSVLNVVAMTAEPITEAELICGVFQGTDWYDEDLEMAESYRYKPHKLEWLHSIMKRVPN